MHQKKLTKTQLHQQIRNENGNRVSSNSDSGSTQIPTVLHQIRTLDFNQSNPGGLENNTLETISTDNKPQETHIQLPPLDHHHDNTCSSTTKHQPLSSTPHKRPMTNPNLSFLPSTTTAAATVHYYHHNQTNKTSSNPFSCFFSFPGASSSLDTTKQFAHKLFAHLLRARLLCFQLRFLLLLSFPSFYLFFLSIHRRFFLLLLLSVLAFSLTLFGSLNLALPRLPALRAFLNRTLLPLKFTSFTPSSNPNRNQVVWSIGSKPKSDKKLVNSGCSVRNYRNGDVYEGDFHRGKCSGSGVYYYYMKGKYEGDWVDGKYDGYGVETWAKGSRYRGQYSQGMRHGIGIYRFYTGDVYAGEWFNGQCHGCGVHTCLDGSRYVGEFKWGVKHGLGCYHFRNGDTYSGEYFADKMHGFGVYQFGNRHRYEGAWHEGRRQGLGMYTFRNGETQAGHWDNGVLDALTTQNTVSGSPNFLSHSKVLDAVKEARQAAEKANGSAKIDERVNRAVSAANKAANAARVAAVKAVQNGMHDNTHDIPYDPKLLSIA